MSKDIVECVHWDPEVDPAQLETRKKNKWVLLAGALAVVAVAVVVSLLIFLPGRREPGPADQTNPAEQTTQNTVYVGQAQPGDQQPGDNPALSGDPVLTQGVEYYKSEQYEAAISNLTLALVNDPASGEAYSYRGLSYFSQGKYEDAVADLIQARRYLGERSDVLTVRGISYYFMGRFPECIGDLTRALELDPVNTNALTYRAYAYDATGRADLAAADRARIG